MTDYVRLGGEVRVNADGEGQQNAPAIAVLADGGIVVAWSQRQLDGNGDDAAVVRVFGANGVPRTGDLVVEAAPTGTRGFNVDSVTALSGGGFVVSYTTGFSSDAKARVFGADGQPAGPAFTVHPLSTQLEYYPRIAALADGGFMAVWQGPDAGDANNYDTYARRFSATGAALTDPFRVNVQTAGYQTGGQVEVLAGGRVVVTWADYNIAGDGSETATKVRLFEANGAALTGEIAVNTTTAGSQTPSDVFLTAGGGFGVIYSNRSRAAGSDNGALVQLFDASGAKLGGEHALAHAPGKVALLDDGSFAVAYAVAGASGDTFVQRYTADFAAIGAPDRLSGAIANSYGSVDVAASATGFDVAYVTTDPSVDGDNSAILLQRFASVGGAPTGGADTLVAPSDAAWTVNGAGGDDVLTGRGGSDRISGGGGRDILSGGNGDDTLAGGAGDDVLAGGAGFDRMAGGAGADRFVFGTPDAAAVDRDGVILDFSRAEGDRIDVSAIDAIAGGGDDAFTFIGGSAFSRTAGELHLRTVNGALFLEGDTNGDARPDLLVRVDGDVPVLADLVL